MEALGFTLLYFYKGQLPWQNLPAFTKSDKYKRIKETKCSISLEQLCEDTPPEFLQFMNHCRNLQFEEKPDYRHLLNLLEDLGKKNKFDLEDRVYDWVEKENLIGFNVLSFGGNKRRRVQQKVVGELSFMF